MAETEKKSGRFPWNTTANLESKLDSYYKTKKLIDDVSDELYLEIRNFADELANSEEMAYQTFRCRHDLRGIINKAISDANNRDYIDAYDRLKMVEKCIR